MKHLDVFCSANANKAKANQLVSDIIHWTDALRCISEKEWQQPQGSNTPIEELLKDPAARAILDIHATLHHLQLFYHFNEDPTKRFPSEDVAIYQKFCSERAGAHLQHFYKTDDSKIGSNMKIFKIKYYNKVVLNLDLCNSRDFFYFQSEFFMPEMVAFVLFPLMCRNNPDLLTEDEVITSGTSLMTK